MAKTEHSSKIFVVDVRRMVLAVSSTFIMSIILLFICSHIAYKEWRNSEAKMDLLISRRLFDDLATVIDDFSRSEGGISLDVERFANSSVLFDGEGDLSDIYIVAREEVDPEFEESIKEIGLKVEPIGWLGTNLAVNCLNPAEELNPEALKEAFLGRQVTWGELAGLKRMSKDEPVTIVTSRRIWELKGHKIAAQDSDRFLVLESDSDVIHYIRNDRYALGLMPSGAMKPGLKAISIRASDPVNDGSDMSAPESAAEAETEAETEENAYIDLSSINSGYNLLMIYKKRPIACSVLSRLYGYEWRRDRLSRLMAQSLNHGFGITNQGFETGSQGTKTTGEQEQDRQAGWLQERRREDGVAKRHRIRIAAVGDIMLDRDIGKRIRQKGPEYPFRSTREIISSADIAFGNLECPISDRGWQINMFRARPEVVYGLTYAGFDVLSLANNHILDYEHPALSQTIEILERNRIDHVGAGMNVEEARKPVIYEIGDVKIAFLAYGELWFCYARTGRPWAASEERDGIAPAEVRIVKEDVEKARKEADIVIVSFHWGKEYVHYPTDNMRKLAKAAVDSGADVIIGHHPHVLQGIEFYNKGIIIYSLGNFVFDLKRLSTRSSAIALIELRDKEVVSIEFVPVVLVEGEPVIVVDEERERILDNLWTYSLPFN